MQESGELLRAFLEGIVESLKSRSILKGEYRVSQTSILPSQNNPLKFSINADDAMLHLFSFKSPGYLSSVDSVVEAFQDIQKHEVALVGGMNQVFEDMLANLSPDTFKNEEESGFMETMMPSIVKAKLWDKYQQRFMKNYGDNQEEALKAFNQKFAEEYDKSIKKMEG